MRFSQYLALFSTISCPFGRYFPKKDGKYFASVFVCCIVKYLSISATIYSYMEYNPHSLHQILTRIREQMRCPQCGTQVSVDFPAIKLAGDDFILLQLRCDSCNAFIVLHVNLSDAKNLPIEHDGRRNVSSSLHLDEDEMRTLRAALQESDGSFEKLFKGFDQLEAPKKQTKPKADDLPSAFL